METLLEQYVNTHENWYEELRRDPYNLKIKQENDLYLFKYNQYDSDLSLPLVQEARGQILCKTKEGKFETWCHSFDKFFNYGEPNAATLNNDITVYEKIDGTLCNLWFNHSTDSWQWSTNGNINAADMILADGKTTLLNEILSVFITSEYFMRYYLPTNYTYMFELVTPLNPLTIYYPETKLYYLSSRNLDDNLEDDYNWFELVGIAASPKSFPLASLDYNKLRQLAQEQDEGIVVRDSDYNRVKIKSDEFLRKFYFNTIENQYISDEKIIQIILDNELDEILSYRPELQIRIDEVSKSMYNLILIFSWEYSKYKDARESKSRKEYVEYVRQTFPNIPNSLFGYLMLSEEKTQDYFVNLSAAQWDKLIKEYNA